MGSKKLDVYFAGWDYSDSASIHIKRLLISPDSPFNVISIIHDDIYVKKVDNINLIY